MDYWFNYLLILIIGSAILILPIVVWRRPGGSQQRFIVNLFLSLLTLFLTLMGLELGFKLFFAQSDGFRYTLASQNWYERYWQENSLGYRDREWTPELLADKTKIMVVGDSFAAGSGIPDPENRFSNQLGHLLGDDYAILTVASPGWDTIDEVQAILEYPYQPDILILSYYLNDIEGVAYESGLQRPALRHDPPDWFVPLVQNSYAINFLYWRLIRLGPQEWADLYWNDWLKKIAADPEIRWRHQQELLTIVKGAAAEETPLLVVVFPNLAAVEESQPFIQPVIQLFRKHNIPVLDVSSLVADRSPAEITVNAIDSHPNETIHREIAEQLYYLLQKQKIIEVRQTRKE